MAALSEKPKKESRMNSLMRITGASSGFGALTARALARAGHSVYASTAPGHRAPT